MRLETEGDCITRIQIVESGDLENPEQSGLAWRNALNLMSELARSRPEQKLMAPANIRCNRDG